MGLPHTRTGEASSPGLPPLGGARRVPWEWLGGLGAIATGVMLAGVDPADLLFCLPMLLLAFGGYESLVAAAGDAARAGMWRTFAGAAFTGSLASGLGALAELTAIPPGLAFQVGAVSSGLLLAGVIVMARTALRGIRADGCIDALVVGIVAVALASRAVVIPGLRDGDVMLTGVFVIDLVALVISATVAVAAPAAADRRTGRLFALITLAATIIDGLHAAGESGQVDVPGWAVAAGWSIAGGFTAAAAVDIVRRRRRAAPSRDPLGWRWMASRVVLPFVAASALPLAGFGRAAMPGMLARWEFLYFGSLSVVVLGLAFGRQAYLLLDNARSVIRERALRQESQRRNEELEALTGLATTMTQSLEEAPIVAQSLDVLHLAARATGTALYFARTDGRHEMAGAVGEWNDRAPFDDAHAGHDVTRLPLTARGEELGLVVLLRPLGEPLGAESLALLGLLAGQLAVAIQNARDYEARLEQAIRDPLTGCYNRRFFFEALEKETARAEREGFEASLVLFDIDDFKDVNDSFGHGMGDHVLRLVVAAIEPLLRPGDSFARIGGEEFALLLPQTRQLEALMVADRLRTAVSRARLVEGRRVTLSGGVAGCPADGTSREDLLRRADAALYWSKRNGKDICALASDAVDDALDAGRAHPERGAHLYGLVASIDGQTRYTRDHSENVAAYASALGQALGLERDRMIVLRRAALLHDIGKVAVPVGILSKPGQLTEEEFAEVRRHSAVGAMMVLRAGLEQEARFVRHHHEHFDGRGYPDGIAGDAIPFESRILLVADSFEAMTSDRAYRAGMPAADAVAELRRCAGTQFDTEIVEMLAALLERGELPMAALRV